MRRTFGRLGFALLLSAASASVFAADPPPASLGINLAGPADWNTELPFVDAFRLSREWISQRKGEGWGKGPKLELDAQGWIKRLDPDCWAETPLCTIDGGHYPSGRYVVRYEGTGTIDASGAAKVVERAPSRVALEVDAKRGGFFLKLMKTDPARPVKNIRVLMPGFETGKDLWNPKFLERWRGMACLRFMDLMETNGSKIKTWADRPKVDDATWTKNGVPIETLCDLANRLKADAWFCIPHEADDAYVKEFAGLVKAKLDPGLKVYVEYSNEVWNGGFVQNRYAGEQGIKLGFASKPWEGAWKFNAHRSVQIFRICGPILGKERMVRVLASQAAVPFVSEQVLGFQHAAKQADVLAIAPYVSMNVAPNGKPSAATVAKWSVDQVMDHVERVSLPEAIRWIRDQKKVADKYGLKLVAYEAGQHLVGVGGAENDAALTKVLTAANAHPRMEGVYRRYYDAWTEAGGALLCHFSSVGAWSKWGSWGLLQYADDDPSASPKFRATMDWGRRRRERSGR